MSPPDLAAAPRAPRPWWLRLVGWLSALAVLIAAAALVLSRSSYGMTTHTVATDPPAFDVTPPPDSVTALATYDEGYLAGPAVVEVGDGGAVARDARTGEELWRYERGDAEICAHRVDDAHVVLLYRNAERCDEVVALSPVSGARQWQRTVEASTSNQIIWTDSGFISLDSAKMIAYDSSQGFERFTLDAGVDPAVEGASSCEHLDAAGGASVVTLQRCRASDDAPWVEQLVVNGASDGQPREEGRSYLSGAGPAELLDAAEDGTALLRDATGTILVYPVGAQEPLSPAGLPVFPGAVHTVVSRGSIVVSDDVNAYALSPDRSSVAWTAAVSAPPSTDGTNLYLPTPAGVEVRAADTGALIRTVSTPVSNPAGEVSVTVSGPLIGVRDGTGLVVLG